MIRLSATLGAMATVALVAGCAPRMAPPPEFADYATNVQIARSLAGGCPTISLDQAAMGAGARDLGLALRAQGFTPEDIAAFPERLDTGAITARSQAFLADYGDSAALCAAARAEIDRGSPIGAFLTAD